MSMKFLKFSMAVLIGIASVNANANADNFCFQLPGTWIGETHIKNQSECNLVNGCTHLVLVTAQQTDVDKYHVALNFTDGTNAEKQELDVTCTNGKITMPISGKYTIAGTCDGLNNCYLVYDDSRFSAELAKK